MNALRIAATLAVALIIDSLIGHYSSHGRIYLDPLTVVVVYVALKRSPTAGMLSGSVAGLMQDAFSAQLLGVSSLGKTIVGYAVGELSIKLDVRSTVFLFPLILVVSLAENGLAILLDRVLGIPPIFTARTALFISIGNAGAGTAIIKLVDRLRPRRR